MKGDMILVGDSITYDENVRKRLKSVQEKYVIFSSRKYIEEEKRT